VSSDAATLQRGGSGGGAAEVAAMPPLPLMLL